jgi:allantoinase
MSDFDLIVRGPGCDFGIADGKFAEIAANLRGSCREEIDATGMLILAGAIDSHVHFNEPGRTDWEGFASGSRAAAAGGTTTIFDMPLNSHPPTIDGPAFDAKRAAAQGRSLVDFALWGGLVPGNSNHLEALRDRGVVGLKAFMCDSGIDDFPSVDLDTLREGMRIAASLDLLMAVHAESQEITRRLTNEKLASGETTVADYLDSRPIEAELEAISEAIECARATGCRLHIVHVSCGRGVAEVAAAQESGVDVTCETCPHYLTLTESDAKRAFGVAKCAPPLRPLIDQKELWNRISGVATIGSDHSPCPPDMKRRKNFFDVWGGISGCQHLLPLLIDSKMSPNDIGRLTSENVADRFRIAEKGGLVPGKDADLAIIDTTVGETITAESLHFRHRQSPYLGRELRGRIVRTILRGQTIYQNGKLCTQPAGKLIRPTRR